MAAAVWDPLPSRSLYCPPNHRTSSLRRLLSRTRSEAPFLFSERGSLALTRALRRVGGGATGFTEEQEQSGLELRGSYSGDDLSERRLFACEGSGGTFDGLVLDRASWVRSQLRGATLKACSAEASSWDVVDLERASLDGLEAPAARFSLVSFRDARLTGCDLSSAVFVLCDFSGARLKDVDLTGARFIGCDFEDAWLEGVDATGADLRSSTFGGAWLGGLELTGARVDDADFRRAVGLDVPRRKLLVQGGARTGGGWLYRGWAALLAKSGSSREHRRALRAVTATWTALAILVPVLFFARASCNPAEPDYGPDVRAAEGEPEDQ
jgi:uncharacterized protein YjbI with pentapeptide repeats